MTNNKTRRALVASLISMMLCVAMLIGSTFAWFTDNASTKVNTIESGILDIKLLAAEDVDAEDLEGKTLTFAKAENAPEEEALLFEPGAKYALQQVWLYNAGNLHAKYQVVITGVEGSTELAQVLDVYVNGTNVGTLADVVSNSGIIKENTIAPKAFDTFGTIELKMQETAGNTYQGLTLDGIAINVQATQAPVEYDSYDNQYDANAFNHIVRVKTQAELDAAVKNANDLTQIEIVEDGTYTLSGIDGKNLTITGTKNVIINMASAVATGDSTLTFEGVTVEYANNASYTGFQHTKKVVYRNCTIKGQQTMYAPEVEFVNCTLENKTSDYCVWTYGATNVVFTDCVFNTSGKAILVYTEGETHANITVNACTFNDDNGANVKKGAVEVGSSPYSTDTTYNIFMNGCVVNGFAVNDEGIDTGSTFWGNKNSMDQDHLNVVIDGTDVY